MYGQSYVHQNNLPTNILSLKILIQLHFCISNGDKQGFHGDMIIVIRVFSSLFYHCLMKLTFSVDKNPIGPYNDPLYQSCYKYGR